MKRISTSKNSVRSDDVPKITQAHFDRAEYRVGGEKVTKTEWQAAIIEHFKTAACDSAGAGGL
jgi:hypothetical protein